MLLPGVTSHAANARLQIVATQPGVDEPVAVRAIIEKSDGSYIPGEWGDSNWPVVTIRGKAMAPGETIEVPLGTWKITIGKGPDYFPHTTTVNFAEEGRTYTVEVELQPIFDMYGKGWRAGDAHVHFFHGDNQVSRTPAEAYAICSAGGLNWVSLAGEHHGAGLLNRTEALGTWEQLERPDCQLWLGSEAPKSAWGHSASIAYDPWSISEALPYGDGIKEVHAQGGVSFPVHPDRLFPFRTFGESYSFYPLNNHNKFLPIAALSGHLLDGWSAISDEPSGPDRLKSYQKLLNMGYKIPLLADSDYCMDRSNNGLKGAGFWVNYVHLDGQPLSRAAVSEAVRAGRVSATTGPLVLFSIDGQLPGSSVAADGTTGRSLRIEANYSFNPWTLSSSNFAGTAKCVIQSVELLRNGEVFRQWNPNESAVVIEELLPPESTNCNYMVRVLGNEGVWMAGYASPIYFEETPKPRQPPVFKSLIQGRLYDASTGQSLAGTVSCVRFGTTEWTIATDPNGLFRARVPIDATLVARDAQGRELARDWMTYEPAYTFGHYLPERYADKAVAIDDFTALVSQMTWEFPIGRQSATSYLKTGLASDGIMEGISVVSAPPRLAGKQGTEIVMLLVDKTQVQHGDTINYTVIFRAPDGTVPQETLMVQFGGWDPNFPRLYTRYGKLFAETRAGESLIPLGGGFFMRQGSAVVPSWVRNVSRSDGGVRMRVTVRRDADVAEDAHLTLPIGPTKRGLLANTMWDGTPATWGGGGVGPCHFSREIAWQARYSDYRDAVVRLRLNGEIMFIHPLQDTATVADADDAIFEDHHYYDAQCEPEYRNIPYRDVARQQPPEPNYSGVAIADPADAAPPTVAAMEPRHLQEVLSPVHFYFHVDDAGQSGADGATLYLNGEVIVAEATTSPVVLDLEPGEYRWQVRGRDAAGNSSLSDEKLFRVVADSGEDPGGSSQNAATFVCEDRDTGGTWIGNYGLEGYKVAGDSANVPSYVLLSSSGHGEWVWTGNTANPVATQRADGASRLAACYYSTSPYEFRFAFRDYEEHRVSFYHLDWDLGGREQRIEVLDAKTGELLAERQLSSFGNGVYLTWLLKGEVIVRIHPIRGNGVVSALFFDGPRVKVKGPSFDPPPGTYPGPVELTLRGEHPDDAIYYTLTGDAPTTNSTRYTGPILLEESTTVSAIAVTPGVPPSRTREAQYVISAPPAPSKETQAEFVGRDESTGGSWKGRYGAEGVMVFLDQQVLPDFAKVTPVKKSEWMWKSDTDQTRALQRVGSDRRLAACWYGTDYLEVELELTDGADHRVSFYFLDSGFGDRVQQVEVLDAATREVLETLELRDFGNGAYLTFRIRGHVVVRCTKASGSNAVMSGIFIDPPAAQTSGAVVEFIQSDLVTRGDWKGKYGAKGHVIPGDSQQLPSHATLTPTKKQDWVWTETTTDPRVLQRAGTQSRIAACWYQADQIDVELNLADGQTHTVSLYCLDWDRASRLQSVEILDFDSGTVLDRVELESFGEGVYLSYRISGRVVIRLTRLQSHNAVISGIFLD